jgi:hypothetical protein
MKQRLMAIATWIGCAIVVVGSILIVRENPIILLFVGLAAIGILILTAWFDYDYWKTKFLCWRHSDLLSSAATLIDPHIDHLALDMGKMLKWDGRSDYEWGPWIVHSRRFVDAVVIPALSANQRFTVANCDPVLREEIRSQASGRIFQRAKQMGLVK